MNGIPRSVEDALLQVLLTRVNRLLFACELRVAIVRVVVIVILSAILDNP